MLLHLPTFNATLNPCPVNPATAFTPHAQGHFCSSCQRVVQDFSRSANPAADLAAARAAAPDGRVCGTFRRAQVLEPPIPSLSRRLRWFLMALVLVVGQGLTAREALAQVKRPVPHKASARHKKPVSEAKNKQIEIEDVISDVVTLGGTVEDVEVEVIEQVQPDSTRIYTYVEQMPQLPGGGGNKAIVDYIQQQLRWPKELKTDTEGRVFASFIVGKDGRVREAQIVKGLAPLLDAETLRVIQALPTFTPGRQSGSAVDVSFTVPVTFKH